LVCSILFEGARERFAGLARVSLPRSTLASLQGCRIAIWGDDPVCPVDTTVKSAVMETVALLRQAGAQVTESRPAVSSEELLRCYRECVAAANGSLPWAAGKTGEGGGLSHNAFLRNEKSRTLIRAAFGDLFEQYDVLLSPTFPCVAFPHGEDDGADQPFYKDSDRSLPGGMPYWKGCFWPAVANLTLLPATAFPVQPPASGGLPVALQAVGPELSDLQLLKFVQLLEEAGKSGGRVAQFRIPGRLR
jgi:amidase